MSFTLFWCLHCKNIQKLPHVVLVCLAVSEDLIIAIYLLFYLFLRSCKKTMLCCNTHTPLNEQLYSSVVRLTCYKCAQLWNYLPAEYFPSTYDLDGFNPEFVGIFGLFLISFHYDFLLYPLFFY